MKIEDLILVSVDDHAIEPPNAFARHMPERFKGREPHVVKRGERDVWVFEEQATGYMGLNSVVGRPRKSTEWSRWATSRCAAVPGASRIVSMT
ncbi:amidohydrolase 2 [Pseudomonas aeruginosa]|nr:amidohydrolase 2 [Pseudomonas aeruginosa]